MVPDPRHLLGQRAERFVARALVRRGWRLLGRDLRTPYAQVDLCALCPEGSTFVLLEVKARHVLGDLSPWGPVAPRQLRRLERALEYLAARHAWAGSIRLDLVWVEVLGQQPVRWSHWPDLVPRAGGGP